MHKKSIYKYEKSTIKIFIRVIVPLCTTKNQIMQSQSRRDVFATIIARKKSRPVDSTRAEKRLD